MRMLSFKKKDSSRKFIDASAKYVSWQVDKGGDCHIAIHDGRNTATFNEWMYTDEPKTLDAFDKSMGILVDEINAFRKAVKAAKGTK